MTDNEEKPNLDDSRLKMSKNVTLAVRLNGTNYPLWKKLMKIAIVGRRANRHITGVPTPPEPGEKGYTEWEESDMIVFSWILDSIDTDIVVDFAHHHIAQALWESLYVTFESVSDPYLLYDLEEKAGNMIQGEHGLETYWRHLHGLWIEIDRCQKCPIDCCDKGVGQFRKYGGTKRLFKFLTGLKERYDGIRWDILKECPLPSVEVAYGWVKREATRLKINAPAANSDLPTGATSDGSSSGGIGLGFAARNQTPQHQAQPPRAAAPPPNRRGGFKPDKSKMWCSHCQQPRHTKEIVSSSSVSQIGGMKAKRREHDSQSESEKEGACSRKRRVTERLPTPEGEQATPPNSRAAVATDEANRTSESERPHLPNGGGVLSEVTAD